MARANRLFTGWDFESLGAWRRWWGKKAPGACEGLYLDGFAHADGKARLLIPRDEEGRQSVEFFSYLAEQDMVGRFITKRLDDVRMGGKHA
jgi:hypothetical protein